MIPAPRAGRIRLHYRRTGPDRAAISAGGGVTGPLILITLGVVAFTTGAMSGTFNGASLLGVVFVGVALGWVTVTDSPTNPETPNAQIHTQEEA